VAELLSDRNKLITAGDPVTATELGGHMIERDRTHRVLEIVAALVAEDKLDPHIEDIRPLDEAAEAIAAVEVGHAKGQSRDRGELLKLVCDPHHNEAWRVAGSQFPRFHSWREPYEQVRRRRTALE
jgi:hypothetical protein